LELLPFFHNFFLNFNTFRLIFQKLFRNRCEISIFSNGSHLAYSRKALTDTILKGDLLWIISAKFGWDWLSSFRDDFSAIQTQKNFHGNHVFFPWGIFVENLAYIICSKFKIIWIFLVFEELIFLIFYSEHISTNVCNLVPKMIVSSSTGDS
jgi:hypothetical protein